MPLLKRSLDGQTPNVADIAGLMGPLGIPGAIGGVMSKLSPEDMAMLNDLLGKPVQLGKRLVRLSSGNPATNKAILHTSLGERVSTGLDEFLNAFKSIGADTAEPFPEGAVITARGVPAPQAHIGPKGGMAPPKRILPGK